MDDPRADALDNLMLGNGGYLTRESVRRVLTAIDAVTVVERSDVLEVIADGIRALPEENATGSRDFGRGYAAAVRDVLALIEAHQACRCVGLDHLPTCPLWVLPV